MPKLNTTVHVEDDRGNPHVFGPGQTPPGWAIAKISNPDVWSKVDFDAEAFIPLAQRTPTDAVPAPSDSDRGQGDDGEKGVNVDELTVPQLREYADDHGIDLDGATKRADILATIKAATPGDPDAADDEDGDAQG